MDKLVKLSAINKLAEMSTKNGTDLAENGMEDKEHGPMTHKCVCICCEAPCETCEEAESEDMPEEDSEDYSEED